MEALRAAGVVNEGLPEEYHEVFEGLSNEELGLIMLVKARLDSTKTRPSGPEDYAMFVPF
jgi:hypothetical protein